MGSEFCESYARLKIDLTNIKTLLRLRMAESEDTKWFMPGGYISVDRYSQLIDAPLDSIEQALADTPFGQLVEASVAYLKTENSFLALERECEDFMMGFLKETRTIAAGPQPLIALLLMKEAEIRNMRMILSGKKNQLSSSLMLDRLGNWM